MSLPQLTEKTVFSSSSWQRCRGKWPLSGRLSALLLLVSAVGHADDAPALTKSTSITRTDSAPIIDGLLDDAAWKDAVIVDDLHQIKPREYAAPSERTEFLLLFDEDAIYIGVRAFDSEPDQITARVLRQGEGLRGEDRARVLLSPFNDKRSGYSFLINANSVRLDGIYKDGDFDREWNGIWQAESSIGDDGWTTELRIPFKTLSFNSDEDWAINLSREVVRKQEEMGWVSRNQSITPAITGTLTGLSDLSQGVGLDIVPALSLSSHRDYVADTDETNVEPSLDLFYRLTPALNASLTINTDFSATEVDNRQVNLTRFNLFFPEKRDFFLRESDIFEFGGIGGDGPDSGFSRADQENGRPYFSRRIGLSDSGQPVDLDVGAKISGRAGRWNIGAQAIRQAEFEDIDATDILVARVSANVLEESNVGFIVTSGDPRSNLNNTVVGVDYLYRNSRLPGGRELNASVWYQQSSTTDLDGDDSAFGFQVKSPNRTGWRGGIGFKEIQENFNPAIGFVSRTGINQYLADTGYTYQRNGPLVRNISAGVDAQRIDLIDGGLQSQSIDIEPLEIESNGGDKFSISYRSDKERLLEPFEISEGIIIPEGTYSFGAPEIRVETGEQRRFTVKFEFRDGEFFDGDIQSVETELGWRPSKHFRAGISYRVDDIELPQGAFKTELVSSQLDIVFSNTVSWVNLIQYDNISESIGLNSRLHWVPQAGRNIYLVLNHNFSEQFADDNYHSKTSDVTLKADYTFRF
jgi:hypothetical protein